MPGDNPPRAGHAVSGGDNSISCDEELCSLRSGSRRRPRFARAAMLLAASPSLAALPASSALAASEPLAVGTFEVIQVAVSVGVVGSLPMESGAPDERGAFLAFGRWLSPRSAAALDHAIMALRERSVGFDLTLETINGAALEAQGRKTAQHVIVRFVSLSDIHRSN